MDKNSERYKQLCNNPKFERRVTRLWFKELNKNNAKVLYSNPPPKPVIKEVNHG